MFRRASSLMFDTWVQTAGTVEAGQSSLQVVTLSFLWGDWLLIKLVI